MLVRAFSRVSYFFVLLLVLGTTSWAQKEQMSGFERSRALEMLQIISNDVKKHYYDPKLHGVDFEAKIAQTKQQIQTTNSFNMAMSHIAALLDSLNDSHTFFLPPEHAYRHDYGFEYQIIGNRCFVTHVRPKRDAEAKGLKPGDEILTLNGYPVNRDDYWKLQYVFSVLRPQPGLRLSLQDPSGAQRQVDVAAKYKETKRVADLSGGSGDTDFWDLIRQGENAEHLRRARYLEVGDQLLVIRVPEFDFSADEADKMISKARKHANLIIDLRGNPGGNVESLKYLIGRVFDREIKIADRVGRKDTKPEIAKTLHNPYTGNLMVLVDSNSASAAEIFARIVQLEKRGTVLGDITSGSVMESRHYEEKTGTDTIVPYGASITEWDLVMTDGKSLEHVGVTPDTAIVPNPKALAAGLDPILAYAAKTMGVTLSEEDAGKAFPYEWPPE